MKITTIKHLLTQFPNLIKIILQDRKGTCGPAQDSHTHLEAVLEWLWAASLVTGKEGVSAGYSLVSGWLPGYPETTGYIIPSLYEASHLLHKPELAELAYAHACWELAHQLPSGAFRAGIGLEGPAGVFDTGQVTFALLKTFEETREDRFLKAAQRAGDFLISCMDEHGCYAKHTFNNIPHTYNVRATWAMARLGEISDVKYLEAAKKNVKWVMKQQLENGYFRHNTFLAGEPVLTHTLGYTLRGLLECCTILKMPEIVARIESVAQTLLPDAQSKGYLAGTYDEQWQGDYNFSCLTGNCQIAIVYDKLAELVDDGDQYRECFHKLLEWIKTTQNLTATHPGIKGGIKGSHPIGGAYSTYTYINWAAKFFLDALLLDIFGKGVGSG